MCLEQMNYSITKNQYLLRQTIFEKLNFIWNRKKSYVLFDRIKFNYFPGHPLFWVMILVLLYFIFTLFYLYSGMKSFYVVYATKIAIYSFEMYNTIIISFLFNCLSQKHILVVGTLMYNCLVFIEFHNYIYNNLFKYLPYYP